LREEDLESGPNLGSSAKTTQRTSSRDFKIRRSSSKGSIMLNNLKKSKVSTATGGGGGIEDEETMAIAPPPVQLLIQKDDDFEDIDIIHKNLIMNHHIQLTPKPQNQESSPKD
jgi:hypothetical protein